MGPPCLPGMREPGSAPESNHLLTVRGATLQILATSPVVRTSLTLVLACVEFMVRSLPTTAGESDQSRLTARTCRAAGTVVAVDTPLIGVPRRRFRSAAQILPL